MTPHEEIGRGIADLVGEGPSAERIAAQRVALVEQLGRRGRPGRPWAWQLAAAAAFVAVVGVGVGVWQLGGRATEASPIAVMLDGSSALEPGGWVSTSQGQTRTLSYSEGSAVDVESDSRVRVSELGAQESRVSLEAGRVRARIVPKTGVRWSFVAGPHEVLVVGTEFVLGWDGAQESMSLEVTKGLVEVRSTGKGRVIPVAAGQVLTLDAVGHRLSAVDLDEGAAGVEPVLPKAVDTAAEATGTRVEDLPRTEEERPEAPSSIQAVVPRRKASPAVSKPSLPEWKELLLANEYAPAIDAAERAGFDSLVATVSASDLQKLGDAARLTGNIGHARQALLGVRERFPGTGTAALAAYSLGRLAVDLQSNDREAVKWFRTYLAGGGSGQVAAGARGRLMDALLRLGDRKGAREVASDYLRYHPNGRHARVAESLLNRSAE